MATAYCSACYPLKIRSHRGIWWSDLLDIFLGGFYGAKSKPQLPRFPKWCSVTHFWYTVMEWCRIVRFTTTLNQKDHWPRSWTVLQEAQRRNIAIEAILILGRVSTYYRVKFGSKYYYFDALPSRFLNFRLDEKYWAKIKLLKAGYPVSVGKMFWNRARAFHYGKKLGFPLVVKPARGTHAYHVTAPVRNEAELEQAILLAKQYQPRFIVEKYLTGQLYRVTVINFNQVYLARREAPNVIGDGQHTIGELIALKNTDLRRGETGQKDTTLHKISLSQRDGLPLLSDILPKNQKIFLYPKVSIGSGGDIHEETPLLHPENREMFRRAARLFMTDLIGFDVIAEDLSRPYLEQPCGIIEANSIPMIDFHHAPMTGAPQNVAGALWDAIIADKLVRYVYPVLLPQRSLWTRLIWHFLDVVVPLVRDFILRFAMAKKFLRRQRFHVGWLRPEITPESAITHLKMNGFEVVRPEWIDHGETVGLRKLLDHERQCHVRFFEDGEVRAHVEYAPEARPFAHLLEQGLHAAQDVVHGFLHQFIDRKYGATKTPT